jgi:hypothetical protein
VHKDWQEQQAIQERLVPMGQLAQLEQPGRKVLLVQMEQLA